MPSYTINVSKKSPLHKRLVTMLDGRISFAEKGNLKRHENWIKAEEITLAYIPESDADALRRNDRDNEGKPTFTTIQIPYTYAQLMSAHTYISSVFFARTPIHQFSGLHGEGEQQTQCVEALIDYQVQMAEMLGPYYIWIYDVLKYGYGVLGEYWDKHVLNVGQIVEQQDLAGNVQKLEVVKEYTAYEGNCVYNIAPYDFWTDPRVPANQFQKGEFVVVRRQEPWTQVLRRMRQGYYIEENVKALKMGEGGVPDALGSDQLERPETRDWEAEDFAQSEKDKKKQDHPGRLSFFEVYVDLVPNEWGLGSTKYPMKWVFTITKDKSTILGATPLSYYHGRFPFTLGECEVEGYGLFNRGMPDILEPIQNTVDWLINSHFYNVRAALNNQFILDPSKIVAEDAADGGPGFRYRLRPEAYGTPGGIDQFFKQIPVQDVTRAHMQDLKEMYAIGERVTGVNDQIMGAMGGTTRRTASEVRIGASMGTNRLKTISEYLSSTSFAPHARRLVQNSQQYLTAEMKLRIVGDLAMTLGPSAERFLTVTPDDIAGQYQFVPVDGNLPIDRLAQANLWKEILVNLPKMPQIMMRYDIAKIFAWTAQLGGLKNINQFQVEVMAPGQAPGGNVIPMLPPPGGKALEGVEAGNSASTQAGLNALTGPPA